MYKECLSGNGCKSGVPFGHEGDCKYEDTISMNKDIEKVVEEDFDFQPLLDIAEGRNNIESWNDEMKKIYEQLVKALQEAEARGVARKQRRAYEKVKQLCRPASEKNDKEVGYCDAMQLVLQSLCPKQDEI